MPIRLMGSVRLVSVLCFACFNPAASNRDFAHERLEQDALWAALEGESAGGTGECTSGQHDSASCVYLLQRSVKILHHVKSAGNQIQTSRADHEEKEAQATQAASEFQKPPSAKPEASATEGTLPPIVEVSRNGGDMLRNEEKFAAEQRDGAKSAKLLENEGSVEQQEDGREGDIVLRQRENLLFASALGLLFALAGLLGCGVASFCLLRQCGGFRKRPGSTGKRPNSLKSREAEAEVAAWNQALAMAPCTAPRLQQLLEGARTTTTGYDCAVPRPWSSSRLMRIEGVIVGPVAGELLRAPLTQRACVYYVASVLQVPSAQLNHEAPPAQALLSTASSGVDFHVALLGSRDPEICFRVHASDVMLFRMREGNFAGRQAFATAPEHWLHFARLTRCGDGPGEEAFQPGVHEFRECALLTGARVTLLGELLRDPQGNFSLSPWPLRQERSESSFSSAPRPSNSGSEPSQVAKVKICDDPALLHSRPFQIFDDSEPPESGESQENQALSLKTAGEKASPKRHDQRKTAKRSARDRPSWPYRSRESRNREASRGSSSTDSYAAEPNLKA